jgi:hypothetical protein
MLFHTRGTEEEFMASRISQTHRLVIALGFCILVFGAGIIKLNRHSSTTVDLGGSPVRWPANSRIVPAAGRFTLVMFVRPEYPHTKASLRELQAVMTRSQAPVTAWLLFLKPEGDLWKKAVSIPGVRVVADEEGKEARRFRLATSGHALVYSSAGSLLFKGEIKELRGHARDKAATASFINLGVLMGSVFFGFHAA